MKKSVLTSVTFAGDLGGSCVILESGPFADLVTFPERIPPLTRQLAEAFFIDRSNIQRFIQRQEQRQIVALTERPLASAGRVKCENPDSDLIILEARSPQWRFARCHKYNVLSIPAY